MARSKRTTGYSATYTEALASNPSNNRNTGSSYGGGPNGKRSSKTSRRRPKSSGDDWASQCGPVVVRVDPSIIKNRRIPASSAGKSGTPKA